MSDTGMIDDIVIKALAMDSSELGFGDLVCKLRETIARLGMSEAKQSQLLNKALYIAGRQAAKATQPENVIADRFYREAVLDSRPSTETPL